MTRFFEGFQWRFVVTAIDSTDPFNPVCTVVTTWAQGLWQSRQVALVLGQPTTIEASLRSNDFRVNGLWTDGFPRVAQTNRMIFCFRDEGPHGSDTAQWNPKAAGIIMGLQDEGDGDAPLTHVTAYDPRKLLEARPVTDSFGALPGPLGLSFIFLGTGDQVALTVLANTIANEGGTYIDAGVAFGGTAFYSGTIETTQPINVIAQAGQSVAEIWQQLEDSGNMDIVLTPIYDPINRPGYSHEVSIYNLSGQERPAAIFGWDMLNHSAEKISRMHDATPGGFFNKVQYYAGQGAQFPIPPLGPLTNGASVAAFGSYWSQQFFPAMTNTDPTGSSTFALASQALRLAKQGKRTLTITPIPERSPVPLIDYHLGDRVPVYASNRLRNIVAGYQRIQGIPIQISDDGVENIGGLLCSPDWKEGT